MLTLLAISSLLVEDGIKADDVYTVLLVGGVMQSGKKTCFPMCKPDLRKGLRSVIALQSFCTKASSQFGLSDWFPTIHKPTGGDGQEEYEYEQSGSVSGGDRKAMERGSLELKRPEAAQVCRVPRKVSDRASSPQPTDVHMYVFC